MSYALWNLARKLKPKMDLMTVTVRDLNAPLAALDTAPDVEIVEVRTENDAGFDDLVRVGSVMRVSRESCMENLRNGSTAWVARVRDQKVSEKPTPAGWAWAATGDAHVREISGTFRGGADSCYYYYDFVRPEFRGKGLQRQLIRHRMMQGARDGMRWAYAIIHRSNAPSLRNYYAEEFVDVARVNSFSIANYGMARVHIGDNPVCGAISVHRWRPSGSFTIFSAGKVATTRNQRSLTPPVSFWATPASRDASGRRLGRSLPEPVRSSRAGTISGGS